MINNNTITDLDERGILVVDDSIAVQELIKKTLKSLGAKNIVRVSNGQQALQKIKEKEENFGFVLLDLAMPLLGGLDCLESIRDMEDEKSKTVIFALTGNQENLPIKRLYDLGFDGVLLKPANVQTLMKIFNGSLKRNKHGWYGVINSNNQNNSFIL